MNMPRILPAALLLLVAGCPGAQTRPTSLRELLPTDLNSCFVAAKQRSVGNSEKVGTATLFQLVDETGAVPAAWVHDGSGFDSQVFFNCATDIATASKFPAENVDYSRAWSVTCEKTQCQRSALNAEPKNPIDPKLAQATLAFAGWATNTDKGWGYYYVEDYEKAVAAFKDALDAGKGGKPDDVRALRGYAQTLVAMKGDLKQAREMADKAVAQKKSAASLESLVRVCLAQKDDECAVKSFVEATKSEDVKARSFDIAALNEQAKAANERLEATEKEAQEAQRKKQEEELAKLDPRGCYKMDGVARATCHVTTCFGDGAKAYVGDLKKLTGQTYSAGEPEGSTGPKGELLVTIPIRGAGAAPKKGKKAAGGDNRDAVWVVTLGDNITMLPYKENLSAYNIAASHNACAPKKK